MVCLPVGSRLFLFRTTFNFSQSALSVLTNFWQVCWSSTQVPSCSFFCLVFTPFSHFCHIIFHLSVPRPRSPVVYTIRASLLAYGAAATPCSIFHRLCVFVFNQFLASLFVLHSDIIEPLCLVSSQPPFSGFCHTIFLQSVPRPRSPVVYILRAALPAWRAAATLCSCLNHSHRHGHFLKRPTSKVAFARFALPHAKFSLRMAPFIYMGLASILALALTNHHSATHLQ